MAAHDEPTLPTLSPKVTVSAGRSAPAISYVISMEAGVRPSGLSTEFLPRFVDAIGAG
jgi:hypothetical protein